MKAENKAYLGLHFAIFLWGFTAILGKLISYGEMLLVWHRMWITCASFLLIPGLIMAIRKIPARRAATFGGIGILVALHWVAFYGSIKYSNASLALSALATSSLFASILEPAITRTRFNFTDMLLGILVIVGIGMIFSVNEVYTKGLIWGIAAAFLAALFSTLNKKYLGEYEGKAVSFIELGTGFLFLTLIIPFTVEGLSAEMLVPGRQDFFLLILLAVGCTTLPYMLSLNALRYISAFKSNLAINLEPVYGILLAIAFLGESKDLNLTFYVGTSLILVAVFLKPALKFALRKLR
ncbi:MAG: DMT family transporter [Flavobacteriales bacterium]|nr:DMT family transporter [Flavobacteriales bacterium]